MHQQTIDTALGCLYDGVREVFARAGLPLPPQARPSGNALSRAAGEMTGRQPHPAAETPLLSPIFTHMNGEHPGWAIPPGAEAQRLHLPIPRDGRTITQEEYRAIAQALADALPPAAGDAGELSRLLQSLELHLSTLPAWTADPPADLSIFDQVKTAAAVGACVSEYLLDRRASPQAAEDKAFWEEEVFLLYSAGLSGIQDFIYTVATDGALRSLRSRSFFLSLFMEHYVDEALAACGLGRSNLLYCGGGRCYLLLPNTEYVTQQLDQLNRRFNQWLFDQFGIRLFLTHGSSPCSARTLNNDPPEQAPYQAMFRRVFAQFEGQKFRRCDGAALLAMNRTKTDKEGRECKVCGRSDQLTEDLCPWCRRFRDLSIQIQRGQACVVTEDGPWDLPLPGFSGKLGVSFVSHEEALTRVSSQERIVRVYNKNEILPGLEGHTRIFVGDYAASNQMEELADSSEGIKRLGVCRMDVDDLGHSFVAGFGQRHLSLGRTAAFSRQMSLFFQCHINELLSGAYGNTEPLQVSIVYSGGDDMFLVGAWSDVIEGANRIQRTLQAFSCGALTISGGIGLYDSHYPIHLAAAATQEMEDTAKSQPGKCSLSLFEPKLSQTYSWDTFRKGVMDEKLACLEVFFQDEKNQRNSSFLHHLLELARRAEEAPINLARFAYLLARLEPPKDSPQWKPYREFSDTMYRWVLVPKHRKELITAIYLYIYSNRKERADHGISSQEASAPALEK